MTSNGRAARLTALALATGTLVAAGAGSAGAANTTKTTYTATGGGSVIRLTVNLPVALPGIGQTITQDLVLTGSNVLTGDLAQAVSTSILGANGNVPLVSGLLQKSVRAEYGKAAPAAVNAFPDLSALGITGKLLALKSSALNPNVDGEVAHSLSSVANLRIDGAGNLQAILNALVAQLTSVLDQAIGTIPTGSSSSSTGAVTGVTNTLGGAVGLVIKQATDLINQPGVGQTVIDAVNTAIAQLNTLITTLPALLTARLKATAVDTSLLSVKLIESEQTITRHAGVVTSKADQSLVGISVLGGLVTVDGLSSSATAALGDGVSTATPKAVGNSSLLHINAADLLKIDVTNGLNAILAIPALPTDVVAALNGVLAQVTGLLNGVLGATLVGPSVTENITNANKASSAVSAARLVVNPTLPGLNKPLFDKPLVDVQFVPAAAQVLKAQSVVKPVVTPAKASSTNVFRPTGADLPLTGAVATALMGLAYVVRRRRMDGLAG